MHPMHTNLDALTGSFLGAVTSLPLATGAVDVPAGAPWWAGYLASLLIALAPFVVKAAVAIVTRKPLPAPDESDDEKTDVTRRLPAAPPAPPPDTTPKA